MADCFLTSVHVRGVAAVREDRESLPSSGFCVPTHHPNSGQRVFTNCEAAVRGVRSPATWMGCPRVGLLGAQYTSFDLR